MSENPSDDELRELKERYEATSAWYRLLDDPTPEQKQQMWDAEIEYSMQGKPLDYWMRKIDNLDAPGIKELNCGCVCERTEGGKLRIVRVCPVIENMDSGDDVIDHLVDGIAELESDN